MFNLNIRMKSAQQDGFTLTELAVILAVVGLLGMLALTALAGSRTQSHLIYCASNMRQVGLAFQMYSKDYAGKLPPRLMSVNFEYDFEYPAAADSPMKLIRSYISRNSNARRTPVFACPAAKPYPSSVYAPTLYTESNLLLSDLVLEKGIGWARNPGGLIMMQENLYRLCGVLYCPERVPGRPDQYSQWHYYGPRGPLFREAREYFSVVHDGGGNLLYVDGHVGYKRSADLNSLDFGLVGLNGQPSPYQPTSANSLETYLPAY